VDANGTHFHLVLGRDDWLGPGASVEPTDALVWHEPDHTLRFAQVPFDVPERESNRRVSLGDRRGAAIDRYGNVYWIGSAHDRVLVQPAGSREVHTFWPADDPCLPPAADDFVEVAPAEPEPQRLSGLAVSHAHHLVVGLPDLPGVLVFDLHGGGPPIVVDWPEPFSPIDLAACPDGGAWVLDGTFEPGASRLWRLDAGFRVEDLANVGAPQEPEPTFVPADGPGTGTGGDAPAHTPPLVGRPLTLTTTHAVAIVTLPDGSALVLDRGGDGDPVLVRHLVDGAVGEPLAFAIPGGAPVDLAYLPDEEGEGVAGTAFVVGEQGDQTIAFALDAAASGLTRLVRYLPMRLFSGKALVAGRGRVHYDLGDRWLPLVDRRHPRYRTQATLVLGLAGAGPADGSADGPFDAGEPGTVWHRLAIDARSPAGTSLRVEARAADDLAGLDAAPWRPQPPVYRRAGESEVAYHRFGERDAGDAGTYELLFQRTVGRLLQLRLTLAGDGRRTPALWSLRAHAPRFSYLDAYLPAVYREDPDSASFLERYLANVEGLFTGFEGRIEHAQVLLRPDTLDAEHLGWLASWLGIAVDGGWDEGRVRLLLQHAVDLYGRRGTRRALIEAIRLATDACPDHLIFDRSSSPAFGVRVVEAFRTRSVPGVAFGDPSDVSGPRLVPEDERWTPGQGRSELDRRWRDHLAARYGGAAAVAEAWGRSVGTGAGDTFTEPVRPLTPTREVEARDRARFLTQDVGITYAEVGLADLGRWREFLVQRHRRISALNDAWGRTGSGRLPAFSHVALPSSSLPDADGALRDWLRFVSGYLPAREAAHRFTVLVPVRPEEADDVREDRVARVRQVVDAERPAHTAFEVRPYWAAFRVGEARLGHDTVLGEGSRFLAIVLGEHRLAAGHVSGRHPWNVPDRFVVGRERVTAAGSRVERTTTDE
jgi:phage tail-like protein